MIFQFLYVPMVFIIKSSSEKSMEKRGIFCKIATLGIDILRAKSLYLEFEMKRVSKNWNRVRVSRGRFMKKEKNIYTIAKEAGVSPANGVSGHDEKCPGKRGKKKKSGGNHTKI